MRLLNSANHVSSINNIERRFTINKCMQRRGRGTPAGGAKASGLALAQRSGAASARWFGRSRRVWVRQRSGLEARAVAPARLHQPSRYLYQKYRIHLSGRVLYDVARYVSPDPWR